MPKVNFTSALKRFFPDLSELSVEGSSVSQVLVQVEKKFPGISNYLLEEDGSLRKHVNVFVKDDLIRDRISLSDKVGESDNVLIYQALSGG